MGSATAVMTAAPRGKARARGAPNRIAAWRLPGTLGSETLVLPDDPHPPEPVPPTPLPPTPQNPQGVPPAIDDPRGPVDPAPVQEPPRHRRPPIVAERARERARGRRGPTAASCTPRRASGERRRRYAARPGLGQRPGGPASGAIRVGDGFATAASTAG